MRVRKLVSLGEMEVDVSVSVEDIAEALLEEPEPERPQKIMMGVNSVAQYLKAITPEMIAMMTPAQRRITGDFLVEQANRYRYE